MQAYLEHSEQIDWKRPRIVALAADLAGSVAAGDATVARSCFEWVRDEILHSHDFQRDPVTCRASEVLKHRTGYCYAKSHLLTALLRARGIPAGLCYQRLRLDAARFCLHGLVAVHLRAFGWYRIDPRGNKPGVDARFSPPVERLAFPIAEPGEADMPAIWPRPLPCVVELLQSATSWRDAYARLPDVEILG